MPDQLSLFEQEAGSRLFRPDHLPGNPGQLLGYKLFLAVFPQPGDAQRLALTGSDLRRQHGLLGKCLLVDRLHITLHSVEDFGPDEVLHDSIDAAMATAAGVRCPALPIVFDRACSFNNRGRPDNNAFVLRCDARSEAGLARLRQALTTPLQRAGLRPQASSTPHMTLLYDQRLVPEHPIEPLHWTASRFALVLSHQGLGHHQWLGEWPLR